MRKLAVMLVMGFLPGAVQEAAAQRAWDDRGYLNIGFGVESGSSTVNGSRSRTVYDEPAQIASTTNWTSGSLLDVGAGVRVWKNFSAGVAYHQESNTSSAEVSGSVPHPIFFSRPRSFLHTEQGLERKEQATHLVFGWMVPLTSKIDVLVTAGPSFFRLNQDAVSDADTAEKGSPFSEVVVDAEVTRESKSLVGYHVGADVTYTVWQNDSIRVGAGAFFRFTGATASVTILDSSVDTKVGGSQFGFGGRIRF